MKWDNHIGLAFRQTYHETVPILIEHGLVIRLRAKTLVFDLFSASWRPPLMAFDLALVNACAVQENWHRKQSKLMRKQASYDSLNLTLSYAGLSSP